MTVSLDQIAELLGDYNEHGQGPDMYLATRCVFHDDRHPSLMIYSDGFRCLSETCGQWGSLDHLLEQLKAPGLHLAPTPTYKKRPPRLPTDLTELSALAERAHRAIKQTPEFSFYLQQRGVASMIDTAQLGWYEGWITAPIMNEQGIVCGLYMRATPTEQKSTGLRFTQPHGQSPMLYCPDWELWKKSPEVFLTFGMMDSLTLSSLKFPVVTTTGGSAGFDPSWLDDWRKPVTIIPDSEGDDKHAIDLAAQLGWRASILRLPYDEQVNDPADYVKKGVNRKDELNNLLERTSKEGIQ